MLVESKSKAAEYRRMASECIDVAERMSIRVDRERMMQVAQQLLDLARRVEQSRE
jgi:hypothetical protein